ncbi:OsmC family protein [Cytobacillus firmus]|nr:OsmC family protein [Cytobacillus firmus]
MANLKIIWSGHTKGKGTLKGDNLEANFAIPKSFNGSGEGTDPKELLVSSAATCYITTLVAMLEIRKLPIVELTMDSKATNSKEEPLKIFHYPHINLSADATEDQIQSANRAMVAADKGCAVGNMLKKADVQIDVEGKVTLLT